MSTIRLKLVDEWRHAWRYWSVKLNGLGLLLLSGTQVVSDAWNQMPPDLRRLMPYATGVSVVLFAAGLVARFVAQPRTNATIAQKMEAGRGDDQQDG